MKINNPPSSIRRSLQELWTNGKWVLRCSLETSRVASIGFVLTALVNALVPASIAVASGKLASEIQARPDSAEPSLFRLGIWLGLVSIAFFVRGTSGTLHSLFREQLRQQLHWSLSRKVMEHSAVLQLRLVEDPEAQDLLSIATRQPAAHCTDFLIFIVSAAASVLRVGSLLLILFAIAPWIGCVLFAAGCPLLALELSVSNRRHRVELLNTRARRWTSYYLAQFAEYRLAASARILNLLPVFADRFELLRQEILGKLNQIHRTQALWRMFSLSLFFLTFAAILVGIGGFGWYPTLTWSELTIVATTALFLQGGLDVLFTAIARSVEHSLYLSHVVAFLETEPAVSESPSAASPRADGRIEMRDVAFSYPGGEPVLRGISLHIEAGETVAIVGHNGSGKSTLAKLLARFYEVDHGTISIGGVDLRDWPLGELHQQLAVVFQEPVRYEASINDNIAFGDWALAGIDEHAVRSAAEAAGADEFIRGFPEGYETHVGKMFGSVTLSGGEWQRLALARALVRDAPILIMDEPALNMDVRAELEMVESVIRARGHRRTTLIISHRFSTIRRVDRIFVLEEGRLVETGTHDQLIQRDGLYAKLYRLHLQLVGGNWEAEAKLAEPTSSDVDAVSGSSSLPARTEP